MTAPRRRSWHEPVMGTVVSVQVVGDASTASDVGDAVAACVDALREIERVFSPFRPDSDVSRMRRRELDVGAADPRVREIEVASRAAELATSGLFSAWWRGWFDPTGIVKGWAVEECARAHLDALLLRPGIEAVGIGVGGDLRVRTAEGSPWTWRVGVADPRASGEVLAVVELRDGAVATSGTAERGAHIVDPRTGRAATGILGASVVAASLADADVWATAAVVAGSDRSWLLRARATSGLLVEPGGGVRRWSGGVEMVERDAGTALTRPGW